MPVCRICRNNSPAQLKPANGFDVYRCGNCRLIWVPDVNDDTISKFYSAEYFKSKNGTYGYHDYLDDEEVIRINARYILSNIPSPASEDSRLLDVGCAYGFLLDESRKRGWKPYGVELSKEAVEFAAGHLKLNVTNAAILNAPFADEFFDTAVIIGSIEHFADPFSVVERVNRLLKTGGHLAVTTIDTEGLVRLYDIKPPEHLYYFTARNLAMLLESRGFKVVKTLPYWCHYHLNEALCRAYRLIFSADTRIEKLLGGIPFLKTCIKVPTNEMFMLAVKK